MMIIIIIIIIIIITKVNLPSFNGNALLTRVFTVTHGGPQLPYPEKNKFSFISPVLFF